MTGTPSFRYSPKDSGQRPLAPSATIRLAMEPRAPCHGGSRPAEEARQPPVADQHHHAEEQHQRCDVDEAVGLVRRHDVEGDHEGRPHHRRARPVEAQPRQTAERRGR